MKIKELRISNYLGIEDKTINPGEKGASIEGDSRKGKTSILNAIAQAVTNENPRTKIVRNEEEPAKIYVEMDDGLKISRTWTADGKKTLAIDNNGMRPSAPETYLKKILGSRVVTIDPNVLMFGPSKEKELSEAILALLPIEVTLADATKWFGTTPPVDYRQHGLQVLKDLEHCYYDQRADINRDLKHLEEEIKSLQDQIPKGYKREAWENVSIGNFYNKVQDAERHNNEIAMLKVTIAGEAKDIEIINTQKELAIEQLKRGYTSEKTQINNIITDLEKQIAVCKNKLENLAEKEKAELDQIELSCLTKAEIRKEMTAQATKELETASILNVQELQDQAAEAEKMKAMVGVAKNLEADIEALKKTSETSADLTTKIETARTKPVELLSQMKLPVKGLSIGEAGEVLIDNLPLKNRSTSELAELLCDIEIAKTDKEASQIEFVCVDRWESIGKELQEVFLKKFAEAGMQLFYTEVTEGEIKITDLE